MKPSPRRRGLRIGALLVLLAAVLLGGAVVLLLRSGPAVSLRIPAGWHRAGGAGATSGAGQITLVGPFGATFRISWAPEAVAAGCAAPCESVPELRPLAATLRGHPVTLRPVPQPDHRLVLQPVREDVSGRTLYFSVACHPPLSSVARVCADIVSSVEIGPPLLQHLRLNRAVVPL
ncbi:MAG TPA: hypothetical protein VGL20_14105 [Candidatus Dormibacteraeota bacterium]